MATVHFGRLLGHVGFSRTVAIKRLHPQFAKDADFVAMFLDEARIAMHMTAKEKVRRILQDVQQNGDDALLLGVEGAIHDPVGSARDQAVDPKMRKRFADQVR